MNKLILCLLGAVLALAASCTSPLTSLVGSKSPSAAVLGPQDAQLVFQASGSGNRAVTGDTYLTVQLKSAADGTVKFASAPGSNGTYSVTVGGMVAGDWNLKVMLYDSQASQVLKYYGNKTQYIAVGSSNNVIVPLYTPGTLNGVTFTDALLADHVTIMDPNGSTVQTVPQPVVIGTSWDLDAQAYSSTDDTTVATQPGVLWKSSNENVATVTANGRVFVQKKGTATITALSAENHLKTASYDVAGVPAVYGTWRKVDTSSQGSSYELVWNFLADTFIHYQWDSEGDFDYVTGDYSYEQGIMKLSNLQKFNPNTNTWDTMSGDLDQDELTRLVSITSETLTMASIYSLVSRGVSESVELYIRVPEVPLTDITLNGVGSGGTLNLAQDVPLVVMQDPAFSPSNATVTGLYWTSDKPTVIGYNTQGQFVALTNTGSATVTAYALDDLATPVGTFTVNAVADSAPQVTFTSGPIYSGSSANISFTITDETRIQSFRWSINTTPVLVDLEQSPTKAYTGEVSLPNVDGDYDLVVTTYDDRSHQQTFTHSFTRDTEGPTVSASNVGTFQAGSPNQLIGSRIVLTDAYSAVAATTPVIVQVNGLVVSTPVWNGTQWVFDVAGVTAGTSYDFTVTTSDTLGNVGIDLFTLVVPLPN